MTRYGIIAKAMQCGDVSNIFGVHHMLFAIISTNSCTSVVFADVGIGILIIHHRLYLYNTMPRIYTVKKKLS